MYRNRIIPCLLLSGEGLVKTERFKKPKYVGDPINAIRIFNDKEVDELILVDIDASRRGVDPNYDMIEQIAGECFMPLCYGGGVKTIEQAQKIFSLGIEKICIQSSAMEDMAFVSRLSDRFGSQSIVCSVDVKKNWMGKWKLFNAKSRKCEPLDWLSHMEALIEAGSGEILLNVVDRDGMMTGMELSVIEGASSRSKVPVIAMGGVGSLDHIRDAISVGASAVAAGSFFVFHGPHKAVLITYPKEHEFRSAF